MPQRKCRLCMCTPISEMRFLEQVCQIEQMRYIYVIYIEELSRVNNRRLLRLKPRPQNSMVHLLVVITKFFVHYMEHVSRERNIMDSRCNSRLIILHYHFSPKGTGPPPPQKKKKEGRNKVTVLVTYLPCICLFPALAV